MFKEDYIDAFSKVTASGDTYRRVMNMTTEKKTKSWKGTFGKILIAAAVLSMLAVTVSAAETGWFRRYFEGRGEAPLSQEQASYLDEKEQPIHEAVTVNGYTMEVKSAITDGRVAIVVIGITAPEDVPLTRTEIPGYDPAAPQLYSESFHDGTFFTHGSGDRITGGYYIGTEDDGDGLDNTMDWVVSISNDEGGPGANVFGPEETWKIHIENLVAEYSNASYREELKKKYPGQEGLALTEEEAAKLNPTAVLAEGPWDFDISFENAGDQAKELVKEPVKAQSVTDFEFLPDGTCQYTFEEVEITSFILRPLSATATVTSKDLPDLGAAWAVLKDGTRILLKFRSCTMGQVQFAADRPVPLDKVDHVLVGLEGYEAKIPMPK